MLPETLSVLTFFGGLGIGYVLNRVLGFPKILEEMKQEIVIFETKLDSIFYKLDVMHSTPIQATTQQIVPPGVEQK